MLPELAKQALASAGIRGRPREFARVRRIECVYLLMLGEEVVFVGQTNNLAAKIDSHCDERIKAFDRVLYFECADHDQVEQTLIATLNPRYNGKIISPLRRSHLRLRAVVASAVDYLHEKGEAGATFQEVINEIAGSRIFAGHFKDFGRLLEEHPRVRWDQAQLRFFSVRPR